MRLPIFPNKCYKASKKSGHFLNKAVENTKTCYQTHFFDWIICSFRKSAYLCNVFFIVLDLRLTKVGVQRYSFFLCPYASSLRYFFESILDRKDRLTPRFSRGPVHNLAGDRISLDAIPPISVKGPLRSWPQV